MAGAKNTASSKPCVNGKILTVPGSTGGNGSARRRIAQPAQKHHHREPGDDEGGERAAGVEGEENIERHPGGQHRGARGDNLVQFSFRPAGDGCHCAAWRRAVSALRLDGAAGADGGFEDVSKPDGHHALVGAEVTRLKSIWILGFGILNGASSRRLLQLRSPHLELALKQEVFDEGNCARRYWQLYFPASAGQPAGATARRTPQAYSLIRLRHLLPSDGRRTMLAAH